MLKPRWLTLVVAVLVMVVTVCGCPGATQPPGILEGVVTIGPLSPVETPGEKPPVPPEVYEARKVMVYDQSGSRLVVQVDIDGEGGYRVELEPGSYTVDINRIGIDFSKDLPKKVEIVSGGTVRLDIDIDTGIR